MEEGLVKEYRHSIIAQSKDVPETEPIIKMHGYSVF